MQKIRNKQIIVLLLTLILSSFLVTGSRSAYVEAAEKSNQYRDICRCYAEILAKNQFNNDDENIDGCHFAVADLDNNGTPELIVRKNGHILGDTVYYTYRDGKAVEIKGSSGDEAYPVYGNLYLLPDRNSYAFYRHGPASSDENGNGIMPNLIIEYKIKNDKIICNSVLNHDEYLNGKNVYFKDGKEISAKMYNDFYNSFGECIEFVPNSTNGLSKYNLLSFGEDKYITESTGNNSIYVKDADTGDTIVFIDHADRIVYDEDKIYYIKNYDYEYYLPDHKVAKLYQYDVETKKHKILKKLTDPYGEFNICELYSGKIYINGCNGSDNIACYCYNINSGKLKKINKSSGYVKRYENYILMEPSMVYGDFWYYPISIYNISTGKTKILTERAIGYSFTDEIVYYSHCVSKKDVYKYGGQNVIIKAYSVKTGKTKTLVKNIKLNSIGKITNKYLYYTVFMKGGESKYYRYTIKTGKKKSLTMEEYEKIVWQ